MRNEFVVVTFSWVDVDPGRYPFDAGKVAEIVAELAPELGELDGDDWADEMTERLVARFGGWAIGWRWARDEGDIGGGPVLAWCCPTHSITTREETQARVAAALGEWRAWLVGLAARFDAAPLVGDWQEVWQDNAVELVNLVVERTLAGDAWYVHCAQVLSWYLQRWHIAPDTGRALIDKAIGGEFGSWLAPVESVVRRVVARAAESIPDGPVA